MQRTHLKRAHCFKLLADFVEGNGGDINGVFRSAELPLTVIEFPEQPILLSDYCRVLGLSARSLEDDLALARMGTEAKSQVWGAFGRWVMAAPTLSEALHRSIHDFAGLQTGGTMALEIRGDSAHWSYRLDDRITEGRRHNTFLTLAAMRQVVRDFCGAQWRPLRLTTDVAPHQAGRELERIFGCPLRLGDDTNSLVFESPLLGARNRRRRGNGRAALRPPAPLPRDDDLIEIVKQLCGLCLMEGRPNLRWVARKLGTNERTLQRHLRDRGLAFSDVVAAVIHSHAETMLTGTNEPIAHIAARLGYADASHFSRAWKRWTETTPREFRRSTPAGNGRG